LRRVRHALIGNTVLFTVGSVTATARRYLAGRTLSALECNKKNKYCLTAQRCSNTLPYSRRTERLKPASCDCAGLRANTSGSSACRAIPISTGAGRGVLLERLHDKNRPVVVSARLGPTLNSTCQGLCELIAQNLHWEWRKSPTRHWASKPINCSVCPRTRCLPEPRTEVQHLRAPLRCVGPFSFVMRPRKCNTRACRTRVSSKLRS